MTRAGATGVAVAVGLIAFVAAFTYPAVREVPVPWYVPLEREWRISADPGVATEMAMDFPGRLLYGLLAGGAIGAVAGALARRLARDPDPESFVPGALTANAMIFVLLAALLFGWTLSRRRLEPPPPMPFERNLSAPVPVR